MKEYRIYELEDGKHITKSPRILDAPNDEAIIEKVKKLLNVTVLEIWERTRLVARLEPKKDHSPR